MVKRFILLVLAVGVLAGANPAPSDGTPDVPVQRMVHPVQHGSAKDLGAVLVQHLGKKHVQVNPVAGSGYLLISGSPKVLAEVQNLLKVIDHQPRMILVEVLVAEVVAEKGTDAKAEADRPKSDPLDLSGPWEKVVAKVQEMRKKGTVGSLKTIRLTTLEGQQGSVRCMENKPVVAGMSRGGGVGAGLRGGGGAGPRGGGGAGPRGGGGAGPRGGAGFSTSMITYRNLGVMLSVTPQVLDRGRIALALKVEDSRMSAARSSVNIAEGVPAADFVTSSLDGKLVVTPGRAAGAEVVKTDAKTGKVRTVIAVTARVVGEEAPAKGK